MNILVATDGSEHARAAVELLLRIPFPEETAVTVLAVLEEGAPFDAPERIASDSEREAFDEIHAARLEAAEKLAIGEADRLRTNGWEVSTAIREGTAWREIVAAAEEADADLVVMGSLQRDSPSRFLLGTIPKKVMRVLSCSVLLARPPEHEREADAPLRMLLAYDGSESSQRALARLASLAWDGGCEITVLTVLTVATTMFRRDILERLSDTWREHKRQAEADLESAAETLRAAGAKVETRLLEGDTDPTEELLEGAQLLDSDVVVAGHGGKSAFKQALLGSVTNQLIEYGPCSVWVVKNSE